MSSKTRLFQKRRHYLTCCCSSPSRQTRKCLVGRILGEGVYRFTQLVRAFSSSNEDPPSEPPKPPPPSPPTTTTTAENPRSILDEEYERLLGQFRGKSGLYNLRKLIVQLKVCGFRAQDERLAKMFKAIRAELKPDDSLHEVQSGIAYAKIKTDLPTMQRLISPNFSLVHKALRKELIVPDFVTFSKEIGEIFEECKQNKDGKVATYIPQLGMEDPELWAVSVCTVDGQRASFGDVAHRYTMQSVSKPFMYGMALERLGRQEVHKYVGKEPSGRGFNELVLNQEKLPHNPMINSGAIIICSLLHTLVQDDPANPMPLSVKFYMLLKYLRRLAGSYVGFSNSVYQSEIRAADRNYALAYYMKENREGKCCFPPNANFHECVDLYFMCCSMQSSSDAMSVMAATLANGGVCPVNNDKVLSHSSVRDMLTLMYSCGMYDYSGEFAFEVGVPAKSGVSGSIILVVPDKLGICCYSPRLDKLGNSARGIQFAKLLNQKYRFHSYDTMRYCEAKSDPTLRRAISSTIQHTGLMYAAFQGDIAEIRFQWLCGANMAHPDYHGRTPLHVAATEGRLECVEYLLTTCHVPADVADKWGRKPLEEAERFGHPHTAEFIRNWIEKGNV